jgi:hypothetical protein
VKTLRPYLLSQVYQLPLKALNPSAVRIAARENLTQGVSQGSSGKTILAKVCI